MGKFRILIISVLLLSALDSMAQQDPHYTQYMYNMTVVNPAYAGSRGLPVLTLLGRTQWVGVKGGARTATLSLDAPVGRAVGLGFSVIHDEIGPVKENNVYGDFSFTVFTGEEGRLAFGIKAGATFLDIGLLSTVTPGDPLNVPVNQISPNFGAGIYYYTDKFYAGLSAPNFLETKHLGDDSGVASVASEKMPIFLTSGYVFDVTNEFQIKPSTMIKGTSGAPISVDLSVNAMVQSVLELGLSYRIDDSISAMIGIQASQKLRLGYAYDYSTSSFGVYNSGSHELILTYSFSKRNMKSPRFF
ncbi:type IX secretion system membrane protein PorP/SprF [Flavicella sp.]|uniref:PorP/SprF family type IX secretion system membrane protein n=1 Tax=Flavicella sp. TaxID=2957742 RepID=UPI002637A52D|nr:type IX secretion system membrane protein PorP/SprF [Flavicella sp.]MDG1804634.1 type IX secretion system membrane protein PorP/SprF [Flavicella sp.]MDG2279413.1 type IX secretion system membrane protein PorP/SprF [Flavicella sp.]